MSRSNPDTPAASHDDVGRAVLETVEEIERALARGDLTLTESDRMLEALLAEADSARSATIEHAKAANQHAAIGTAIAIAIAVVVVGYVAYRWLQMFEVV